MFTSSLLTEPGVHEKAMRARFGDDVMFTGDSPVFDTPLYLLAFCNRSGSNLLASHLRSTRYFGGFHEQLNAVTVEKQSEIHNIATNPDYIRTMTAHHMGNNKVYGFKASWDQMMMLLRFGIDRMYTGVQVIHITRADVLKQAISYHIAVQTKQWTSKQDGLDVEPVYDAHQITRLMEESARSEMAVRQICAMLDIPRMHVRYETLVRDPEAVVQRAARFADTNLGKWRPKEPPIQKQSNEINNVFYDRYVAEQRAALRGAAPATNGF